MYTKIIFKNKISFIWNEMWQTVCIVPLFNNHSEAHLLINSACQILIELVQAIWCQMYEFLWKCLLTYYWQTILLSTDDINSHWTYDNNKSDWEHNTVKNYYIYRSDTMYILLNYTMPSKIPSRPNRCTVPVVDWWSKLTHEISRPEGWSRGCGFGSMRPNLCNPRAAWEKP